MFLQRGHWEVIAKCSFKPQGSSHATECDRAAVWGRSLLAHCVFGHRGLVAARVEKGSSALHRMTPFPSSPFLCFPCKVWGFSKQTGGDKHMLWTALCWVVSEVQQSRSLSDCSYTSHSGVDGRTGPWFYPCDDKLLLGSLCVLIRESAQDCWNTSLNI